MTVLKRKASMPQIELPIVPAIKLDNENIGGHQGRFYVGTGKHSPPPPNVGQAPQIFWFQQQKYVFLQSRLFLYSGEINTRIS